MNEVIYLLNGDWFTQKLMNANRILMIIIQGKDDLDVTFFFSDRLIS